jgi:hypothetical protein
MGSAVGKNCVQVPPGGRGIMARILGSRVVVTTAVLVLGIATGFALGPVAASASDGDPLIVGSGNFALHPTGLTSGDNIQGFQSYSYGSSANAIMGWSINGVGIFGKSNTGSYQDYLAWAGDGVLGQGSRNGVSGVTGNNTASGVYGQNDGSGFGVAGRAPNGTGVLADSANGTALKVTGRTKFSTAGTAVVASGQKKVTVTLAGVTATDFILATVQGSGAFFVKNASAGSGQFTININKAPTAPATVKVAYFVISPS